MLSVSLVVGFPVLGAAVVAGLVLVDILLWRRGHLVAALVVAAAAASAALVLTLVHRRPRFCAVPGGVSLELAGHPRLRAVIGDLAAATDVRPPDEVWITPHPNAFALQETTRWGATARRTVLGIGMPLLVTLSVDELRAVVGHELGHFSSADSAVASIVHRGRLSMIRTMRIPPLSASRLFGMYGRFFLRVTAELSRRQELAADRLAAQLTDPAVAAASLVSVERTALAYGRFLEEWVGPVWVAGCYPERTFQGFARLRSQLEPLGPSPERPRSPYDSHPPLSQRLTELAGLPAPDRVPDATPAWSLVEDLAALDRRISATMAATTVDGPARAVDWDDIVEGMRHGPDLRDPDPLAPTG